MKAFRALVVLGLFVFMSIGANAQNSIKRVNKNQVQSKQAPQKTEASYQVQKEVQKAPAAVNPVPVPYPNTSTTPTKPIKSNNTNQSNEIKVAPSSGSQNNSIQLNSQQTKALEKKQKENYKK